MRKRMLYGRNLFVISAVFLPGTHYVVCEKKVSFMELVLQYCKRGGTLELQKRNSELSEGGYEDAVHVY